MPPTAAALSTAAPLAALGSQGDSAPSHRPIPHVASSPAVIVDGPPIAVGFASSRRDSPPAPFFPSVALAPAMDVGNGSGNRHALAAPNQSNSRRLRGDAVSVDATSRDSNRALALMVVGDSGADGMGLLQQRSARQHHLSLQQQEQQKNRRGGAPQRRYVSADDVLGGGGLAAAPYHPRSTSFHRSVSGGGFDLSGVGRRNNYANATPERNSLSTSGEGLREFCSGSEAEAEAEAAADAAYAARLEAHIAVLRANKGRFPAPIAEWSNEQLDAVATLIIRSSEAEGAAHLAARRASRLQRRRSQLRDGRGGGVGGSREYLPLSDRSMDNLIVSSSTPAITPAPSYAAHGAVPLPRPDALVNDIGTPSIVPLPTPQLSAAVGRPTTPQQRQHSHSSNQHQQQQQQQPFKKLKMLMTNADTEGVHTFTFCLVMFSKEIKRLIMTVEALQQHMLALE